VEGLTPSKMGGGVIAQRGAGNGNVEAPAPTTAERIGRTLSGVAWDERT
jgi:hypothetical protein